MLYAVVSDVHGNRQALEAVLAHARRRGAEMLLDLGDTLYGPLDPRGTWELLNSPGLPAVHVMGNQDRDLFDPASDPALNPSLPYARSQLGAEQLAWLRALPAQATHGEVRACHGTPSSDQVYLLERITAGANRLRTPDEIARLAGSVRERVLLCGHSHVPRAVQMPGGTLVVNPGSVGVPAYADAFPEPHRIEAGSPHARYALLRVERAIEVELVSLEYDWNDAARTAEKNGRADWAHALRTGFAG